MDIRSNLKVEYVLTPEEDDSTTKMSALAREGDPEAKLLLLGSEGKRTTLVIEPNPLVLPIKAVLDHPNEVSVERLHSPQGRAPMHQVTEVTRHCAGETQLDAFGEILLKPLPERVPMLLPLLTVQSPAGTLPALRQMQHM